MKDNDLVDKITTILAKHDPIFYAEAVAKLTGSKEHFYRDDAEALIEKIEGITDVKQIQEIITHPISGKRQELFPPKVLNGDRAVNLLYDLKLKSLTFKAEIINEKSVGYIRIY